MNLLDLGILVLLGLITVRGYYRGLFQELAVLVGLVGGVVVASHTYLPLAELFKEWIRDPLHARVLSFVIILVAVYWVTRLLAHFLQKLLYHLYLDLLDRLLGGFFALIKATLFLGFTLMLLSVLLPRDSRLLKESLTAPYLMHASQQALALLPPDFKQRLHDYLKQWKKPERQKAHWFQGEGRRIVGLEIEVLKPWSTFGKEIDRLY
jgi:membrane protein required for colicin V production